MLVVVRLLFLVSCFAVFSTVSGCGQLPSGRERTVNFILTDFKLVPVMTYTADIGSRSRFPTVSPTKSEAETFVKRLIMGIVEDVLYQQGRSALLSDNVISLILQQLDIQVVYEPLDCDNLISPEGMMNVGMKKNCIVAEGVVTGICMGTMNMHCMDMANVLMHYRAIDAKYFSISGSLKTSNIIMANWSNQMWQSVLNRVLRSISSSSSGSNFYGASINIR